MIEKLNYIDISKDTVLTKCFFSSAVQDSQAFIWLATNLGLARYDGYSFKMYNPKIDGSGNSKKFFIECMYLHKEGKLLLLTSEPGVYEFDMAQESFRLLKSPFLNSTFNHNNIVRDKDENYWVGTEANGLFKLDKDFNFLAQYKVKDMFDNSTVSSNHISNLYYDENIDRLYIGTDKKGLNVFDYSSGVFSCFEHDKDNAASISSNSVRDIFRDSMQNLWICTGNGLNLLNETEFRFKSYQVDSNSEIRNFQNTFHSVCEDDQDFLLIGTHHDGILYFDPSNGKFHKPDINAKLSLVNRLIKDKYNVIWVSAMSNGIGIINCLQKKFYHFKNDFDSEIPVTAIYEDTEKNLWIGTEIYGLYKATRDCNNNLNFIRHGETGKFRVNGILASAGKFLFIICSSHGIYRVDLSDGSARFFDKNIFSKYYEKGGLFVLCSLIDRTNKSLAWISLCCQNLVLFNLETETIEENDLISETLRNIPVVTLYMDFNCTLWIGTAGCGLYKYDTKQNVIVNYRDDGESENGISDSYIYSIVVDSNNNTWVGTENGGLNMLKQNCKDFRKFVPEINSPMESMVLDDSGNLWISTMKGILKFDTKNLTFSSFTESDGLLEDGYNYQSFYKSGDGIIYFGGKNGITYFNPMEIKTNPHIPNIALSDFQIFYESVKPSPENPFLKKSISYAKEITLTHKESVITFEFAALIFNNPKMNQYAYKMEGFDEDWVYCGTRRTATYTNLDPGEYIFRVKGSNNDGLWNEEGTSIKVIITPPWYKTVLFKGLVGLSVIGSIGSFYRKRIQKLNKEKSLQEEFTKKLIESQENERKRVAAELHDSLGQDLLIIKNKALVSIKKTNDLEKFKKEMNEISDLTSATLNDVREISYNLRPYELDRLGLTKTIESMIERANNSTNINFVANIDNIDNVFIPEVEINIYRIIQESLNNVIKHSEAKEVIVSVLKKEKSIIINISDDGKGFDMRKYKMNSKKKGFGLKGIEERVRLMNGEFRINSESATGTIIEIVISLKK